METTWCKWENGNEPCEYCPRKISALHMCKLLQDEQRIEAGQHKNNYSMKPIKTTVEGLDDVKHNYKFDHFTVRNGKAKYHLLHVPDNTVGLYYALRVTDDGLSGRRALEPVTEITCWVHK